MQTAGIRKRRGLVVALAAGLAALAVVSAPGESNAHAEDETYVYLNIADDVLWGQVEMPYVDIRTAFELELDGSDAEVLAELEDNVRVLQDYAAAHLSIGDTSRAWELDFEGVETLSGAYGVEGAEFAVLRFTLENGDSGVPQTLTVTLDPFFDEMPGSNAVLLIATDRQLGVFDKDAEALVRFDADSRTQTIDLGATSQRKNFTESIDLGIDHIQTGPDHILFVLVLLLPSVLIYRASGWTPQPTFGASLWRVLKIVSMFTVAHSITFTLAGLDILPLPSSRVVESVIALSIAVAALHNLKPVGAGKEWLIAFSFGLFHGMGFASLVADLDVTKTTRLASLLGRNVGIEIGQAFIVLVMFPALYALRRTGWYRPFFTVGSVLLAIVSLGWLVERGFAVDIGTTDVMDELLEYPRVLLGVLIFDLACGGAYWWARRNGTLIELERPVRGSLLRHRVSQPRH
jgi:hypothetical protein